VFLPPQTFPGVKRNGKACFLLWASSFYIIFSLFTLSFFGFGIKKPGIVNRHYFFSLLLREADFIQAMRWTG